MAKIIFWIFGAFYGLYPVKLFIRKRIEKYFFRYHIAKILQEASSSFPISDHWNVRDLADQSPFRGLVSEFVRAGDYYPNPKDIAIAINISIRAYCNEKSSNLPDVIDLAFHISQEIKSRLISDQSLKIIFNDLNKDLSLIQTKVNREEIEKLFENKKALFLYYYSTFSKPEFNYSIKVWHQSQDNSYINWNEEDALVVHLNPARIREGFFQTGFDYYCNQTCSRLQRATKYENYEQFNGDYNGEVIWAR